MIKNNRHIWITALILAVLCMAMGASNAADKKAEPQQQTYVQKTIVDVPWGDKPEEFGLVKGPPERFGARTFTLDGKGNIYIYDHVKSFVKKFDKEGNFQGNIGPVALGSSIAAGVNGHVFVIRGHDVDEYLKSGKLLKTYEISRDISLIPGAGQGLRFDGLGNLYVKEVTLYYQIGSDSKGKFAALSHQEQKASKGMGFPALKNEKRIMARYKNKKLALIQILDTNERIIRELPITTENQFLEIIFLGQDKYGYMYVLTGVMTSETSAHFEVRKVDNDGNQLAALQLTAKYYTETDEIAKIDEDGNVYQLLTTPQGVQVIRWESQ